jgi:hypothetical protein
MNISVATKYFAEQVPMSMKEARSEVLARLAAPAQGLSYVVGKAQLFDFSHEMQALHQAQNNYNDDTVSTFDIAKWHANIETNGNLPVILQKHAAGLNTSLDVQGFVNLHSAFDGVPNQAQNEVHQSQDPNSRGRSTKFTFTTQQSRLMELAFDPNLVRRLPGLPPPGNDKGDHPVILSGYQTVANGTRGLFYTLVHAASEAISATKSNLEQDVPIMIWLQGGNGCSSLIGALTENGPYKSPSDIALTPDKQNVPLMLQQNPSSLHRMAHVIYLDRPAGVGFSWTTTKPSEDWVNDKQTASDSLEALRGLLGRYSWLCGRTIWVAGESYAGHFTVQLATKIADAEEMGTGICGSVLGGVLIGNGVVDINQVRTNYIFDHKSQLLHGALIV